jgi:pimeloyl-ACP methyl ester carboxylesterase
LHGWTSTADITWHGVISALTEQFAVVAPDLRGHGGGPRDGRAADIGRVAADLAALIEQLDIAPAVVVGYSLGGAVAQQLGRERPDLVAGLVLCASAYSLAVTPAERLRLRVVRLAAQVAAVVPAAISAVVATVVFRLIFGDDDFQRWVRSIVRHHDWSEVLALGAALAQFDSRHWIGDISVPCQVVITADDAWVPPQRQRELAQMVQNEALVIAGGHSVCLTNPRRFAAELLGACRLVAPGLPRASRQLRAG